MAITIPQIPIAVIDPDTLYPNLPSIPKDPPRVTPRKV